MVEHNKDPFADEEPELESLSDEILISEPMDDELAWDDEDTELKLQPSHSGLALEDHDSDLTLDKSDSMLALDQPDSALTLEKENDTREEGDTQPTRPLSAPAQGAILQEAERQQIRDYQGTIDERDRIIVAMEEAQQFLEDELEDANTEIDRIRREMEKLTLEVEEAEFQRKEAESVRRRVEKSVYQMNEGSEHNMLDRRLHRGSRTIGINQVTLLPMLRGFLAGMAIGVVLSIALLELGLYLGGQKELFTLVFGS